jgi:hypothetical protein
MKNLSIITPSELSVQLVATWCEIRPDLEWESYCRGQVSVQASEPGTRGSQLEDEANGY